MPSAKTSADVYLIEGFLFIEEDMEIYLDNSATTRVYDEVVDLTVKLMKEDYGNPSSMHHKGVVAENYIKKAAEQIAIGYFNGDFGEKNPAKAKKWASYAAKHGSEASMELLEKL